MKLEDLFFLPQKREENYLGCGRILQCPRPSSISTTVSLLYILVSCLDWDALLFDFPLCWLLFCRSRCCQVSF